MCNLYRLLLHTILPFLYFVVSPNRKALSVLSVLNYAVVHFTCLNLNGAASDDI